ncbi:hypothetical protein THTE_2009 [Thermogutta terrifontis]|uniref:Uncharacterized protein n=1 Tax=Thermogutta terrifontis TaxID=1331910 RepID=A0A286RF70_9BACT|nr:hypothetical protein THTE_2009 [Thermogutta terrifontis]
MTRAAALTGHFGDPSIESLAGSAMAFIAPAQFRPAIRR